MAKDNRRDELTILILSFSCRLEDGGRVDGRRLDGGMEKVNTLTHRRWENTLE